jgi:peptidoglycan/LPS O-acetylase OafA/YrhL
LSILYVLFFLIGAILFVVLAASFHRRHRTPWTAAVIGLLGAPLLLSVVLVIAPRILSHLDLLPS